MRTDPLHKGDQTTELVDSVDTHGADLIYQSFSCLKLSSPSRNIAISGPSPLERRDISIAFLAEVINTYVAV